MNKLRIVLRVIVGVAALAALMIALIYADLPFAD